MRIVPIRETCIYNFVGCSARLQKRQASAIYLDHTKTHVLCRRNSSAYGYLSRLDHPFGNASATAVWEAALVRTIDKRYGRERGHKATLAALLRESGWALNAISPS
jgi:hypothetical protein